MQSKNLKEEIESLEKNIGAFSVYQTTAGPGQDIPFTDKPAQQYLAALGVASDINAPLSKKNDSEKPYLLPSGNPTLNIGSFSKVEGSLEISGARVDRLIKSAKTYVNSDIFPGEDFSKIPADIKLPIKNIQINDKYLQNMAVGICHVQEIDLLITHQNIEGKAISAPRTGRINENDPAILLLSSPALNCSYGAARELTDAQKEIFIKGMFRNLFYATQMEGREYIALPAAGLGAFGGEPKMYFKALIEAAKEFPGLNIIYHPAQFSKEFDEEMATSMSENIVKASKDVLFIADELTKAGKLCALHNPSDADVVLGVYDVGEYWKAGHYVGEEHIGSMTTAPLNSKGLNPSAYSQVHHCSVSKQLQRVNYFTGLILSGSDNKAQSLLKKEENNKLDILVGAKIAQIYNEHITILEEHRNNLASRIENIDTISIFGDKNSITDENKKDAAAKIKAGSSHKGFNPEYYDSTKEINSLITQANIINSTLQKANEIESSTDEIEEYSKKMKALKDALNKPLSINQSSKTGFAILTEDKSSLSSKIMRCILNIINLFTPAFLHQPPAASLQKIGHTFEKNYNQLQDNIQKFKDIKLQFKESRPATDALTEKSIDSSPSKGPGL